ncbi:CGR1 Cell growth-regulated gene 1 protein [Candida maltosa Xu316]|uniref:Cell growth-regulated gene 1 protein n=1 Tax=Candida maltosa (strain Xu316) TaxID=1245528 RepID=M3J1Y1_CANMX|nr:Cell growth-regulated gene 1 protein [Candida maltosa Xu316]
MTLELTKANIFPTNYRGRLTEGITYDQRTNTLFWVDIIVGEVHRVQLDTETHDSLKWDSQEESIGAIGLTTDPTILLVCGKYGIGYANFNTHKIEYFFKYPHENSARLRSNDGIVDPWGNLWIGVMTDFPYGDVQKEGKLYRITPDLKIDTMVDGAFIPNGLAFNERGDEFYWTDSLTYTIWKFDYDHETNTLSNRREFINLKDFYPDCESPEPDGFVMTNNGEIYTCVFSTSTILHVDNQGKEVERIKLPAKRITCATIGGEKGDELFVTTAHLEHDNLQAVVDVSDTSSDLGGFIFRLKTGTDLNGQKKNIWGGKV